MKRWLWATLSAIVGALWVLANHSSNPAMLRDSDTAVALRAIRARGNPWSWFTGDWPLENHFYRPISTLPFELDNWLYRDWAPGYGWTNAIIAALCVLLLGWFLREITDQPATAAIGTLIFANWHEPVIPIERFVSLWILVALIGGMLRHRLAVRRYWIAPMVLIFTLLSLELAQWQNKALLWIPSRTATVMTVFCLLAMALYARYERLGAERKPVAPTPLDPPATRNTAARTVSNRPLLVVGSLLACALALGAYEQAVMLPACLLGVACSFRLRGYRVRWGWQAGFWTLLVGYIGLRQVLLPHEHSGYQEQQLRYGMGVFFSLSDYSIPFLGTIPSLISGTDLGILMLVVGSTWYSVIQLVSQTATVLVLRKDWIMAFTGWGLALLAFLPMAWLQPFAHYHYWPLALRTIFIVALLKLAVDQTISAWSPQGSQAPPRPHPAPGSLPRP